MSIQLKNAALLLLLLLPCFGWRCATSLPKRGVPAAGTYHHKLNARVMGARRHYRLHIPARHNPEEATALVMVLHGAFCTARKMESISGFSEVADREGFLVAYPSGAYGVFGFLRHWNAGHCCGKAAEENLDDIGFLDQVIDDISQRVAVDNNRIYMVGFSNGGMLTYRYAAERTHRLAAAASVGAALGGRASQQDPWWSTPQPTARLPIIVFHALDDDSVPYDGGVSPRKGGEREYVSVAQSIDFWKENNQCYPDAVVESLYGGRVTRSSWADDQGENPVTLYAIDNWGHRWPGQQLTKRLDKNNPFHAFNAADIIWDFFKDNERHPTDF